MLTAVTRRAPDRLLTEGYPLEGYQVVSHKTADQLFDSCLIQPLSIHAAKLGVYEMQYTAIGGILLLAGP